MFLKRPLSNFCHMTREHIQDLQHAGPYSISEPPSWTTSVDVERMLKASSSENPSPGEEALRWCGEHSALWRWEKRVGSLFLGKGASGHPGSVRTADQLWVCAPR